MTKQSANWQKFLRVSKIIGLVLMWIFYVILWLWCFGAISYAPYPGWICTVGNIFFTILVFSAPFIKPHLNFTCAGFALMLFVVICWQFIRPSDNRSWQPGFEKVATVKWINQDTFTIQNMRDCRYITEHDFKTFYKDATYKISEVTSVKFISVYWEQEFEEEIAHNMIAFSFSDGRILVFSYERRCSQNSEFGPIPSLYKQSEICCVVSEPSDMLALRTHFRAQGEGERVYMYEMKLTPAQRRDILRNIVMDVNELGKEPEFFNTVTSNCATKLVAQLGKTLDFSSLHYSMLFNGFLDEYFFDKGFFVKKYDSETFDEVKGRSFLNDYAKKHWTGYDKDRIDDREYRDTSYHKLILAYYGQ